MTSEKKEQVQLLTWFLIIVGPAMAIPGALLFGMVKYLCGYLMFSALLLASVLVFGNLADIFQRVRARPRFEKMTQWD